MPSRRTLHIVDDDDDVRESAALLLEAAGYQRYDLSRRALNSWRGSTPRCPPASCSTSTCRRWMDLEVQRRLVEREIAFPVIVLTGQGDISIAVQAMKRGAFEFLEKPYLNDVLLEAVRDAFVKLESTTEDRAVTAQSKAGVAKLTGRESEVLRGLLAGLPNKLIAYELDISVRTVEIYRANVMEKLDAKSLSAAVRIALAAQVEPLVSGGGR